MPASGAYYPADADLLATLDDIQRENFALIVDENNVLTGIVTTADTTVYFQDYAQDLMQIEGIESRLKDAIKALYAGDDAGLQVAIEAITDRASNIRKKLPAAIKAYLGKANLPMPATGSDGDAIAEAEKRLGLTVAGKGFGDLSFDEITHVLLCHPNAPRLSLSKNVAELRGLLEKVRNVRNKLAHFKGELTLEERRMIHFAAEWLERNLPMPTIEKPTPPVQITLTPTASAHAPEDEEHEEPHGSYAPLASHLRGQLAENNSVTLTFQEVERILGKELPRSALEYRAWWSNDPTKPQSAAWLDEGWRTTSLSMTEQHA